MEKPPEPRFTVSVKSRIEGVWNEQEWKETGKDEEGNAKYGYVDVAKWRTKETEVFRFEADREPDLLALSRLMTKKPKTTQPDD